MQIFDYRLRLNPPGRPNPWALFLVLFSTLSLIQGIVTTDWMASYRKGDSLIPAEQELTEVGPFLMSTIRTRNSPLVGFSTPDGILEYEQNANNATMRAPAIAQLVSEYAGRPIAYLLIYKKNPTRQIWGIKVNGSEVLSYRDAVLSYKAESSSAYLWFWCFFVFMGWFFISIVDVQRIRKIK